MKHETSISKGHPIESLDAIRSLYRNQGIKVRIRFRGPRRDAMRLHCLKRDAKTFAVYPR